MAQAYTNTYVTGQALLVDGGMGAWSKPCKKADRGRDIIRGVADRTILWTFFRGSQHVGRCAPSRWSSRQK